MIQEQTESPIHGGQLTVKPVAATVATVAPEFLRYPRAGEVEPVTGLRRAQLYNLANAGVIKTVSLRRNGKLRGTRLIVASSLLSYLRGLAAEQNPPAPPIAALNS